MLLCFLRTSWVACFTARLNRETNSRRNGVSPERDESKIPVEPEHQAYHADNRQQVDSDSQRGRTRKLLNGIDVVGDRAEHRAGLMAVVIAQRELLQMVVRAHAQVMGNPLAHAFRVVILNVGRDGSDERNRHERESCQRGEPHLRLIQHQGLDEMRQPFRQWTMADH